MPINPRLKHLYPADWNQISHRIKFERAKGRCESCGAEHLQPHPVNGKRTILSTAHLNHDPADNREENLACLCARCHLRYDLPHHVSNAKATRQSKRINRIKLTGQLSLWGDES